MTLAGASGDEVVVPDPEFDHVAAPLFLDAVSTALDAGASRVVVDLSMVTFMDSSALAALLVALRRTAAASACLLLWHPGVEAVRLLHRTGLHHVFAVEDRPAT